MSNKITLLICLVVIIAALISEYIKSNKTGEKAASLPEFEDKVILPVYIGDHGAVGYKSLLQKSTGSYNVAIGKDALVERSKMRLDSVIDENGRIVWYICKWPTGNTSAWAEKIDSSKKD